jgi:5-methyltetrahydropteroyltriglutamate--homocysteine methyltransferase
MYIPKHFEQNDDATLCDFIDAHAFGTLIPELIAERIVRFARLVGRENVIAGADCGFAASAVRFNDTHASVAWLKFAALTEGARLATQQLW